MLIQADIGNADETERRLPGGGETPVPLKFSLLGPVRAWSGDAEIDLGSPQQRALLAVLLLRLDEPVTSEEAVRALWGEAPPPSANGTVRTYVYRLRRKMTEIVGPHRFALHSRYGGYLLTVDGATIDTHAFQQRLADARQARTVGDLDRAIERFSAALTLWRGVPFAGLDAAYFNTERDRLEQLHAAAIEELTTVEIVAGNHASAVATLRTALAAQPLQENLWELLLQALSGLGRRADALAAYQDAREVLQTELGLEPSPRLRELHRRILKSVPVELGTMAEHTDAGTIDPPHGQTLLSPDGFVGRRAELSEIASRMLDARQPALIGLTGEPDVGKTALAVHAAHVLRPHFPDGQFYAGLVRSDGTPVAPEKVLVDFLRRCDIPLGRIPCTLPELTSLWRSTVDGKRILIVLDDVLDGMQVLPLLPASTSPAVLVVSRGEVTGLPALRTIPVGGLTRADALQLLGSIIGHHSLYQDVDAAARLVAACRYHPQTVRTAAMRFLSNPQLTLEDVERKLRVSQAGPAQTRERRDP